MLNKEKYKTFFDAFLNFNDECFDKQNKDCKNCPYNGVDGEDNCCMARWLFDEAKETENEISND